jgi:hypothetical protein
VPCAALADQPLVVVGEVGLGDIRGVVRTSKKMVRPERRVTTSRQCDV